MCDDNNTIGGLVHDINEEFCFSCGKGAITAGIKWLFFENLGKIGINEHCIYRLT